MLRQNRDSNKRETRLPTSNIDTTITVLRLKKADDGDILREVSSLTADEDEGVTERIITNAIEDTRGRPITKAEDIAGACKVCVKTIKVGDEVECEGRCGELLCRSCYQKQGGHILHDKKYCRWDYWVTKFFWQWVSPSLRSKRGAVRDEEGKDYGKSGYPPVRTGRHFWPAQQENQELDKSNITKAR